MASLGLLSVLLSVVPFAHSAPRGEPAPLALEGASILTVECGLQGEVPYPNPWGNTYFIVGKVVAEKDGQTYAANVISNRVKGFQSDDCLKMRHFVHEDGATKATLELVSHRGSLILWSARFEDAKVSAWSKFAKEKIQFSPWGHSLEFKTKLGPDEGKEMFLQLLGHCMDQEVFLPWIETSVSKRKSDFFQRILLASWKKKRDFSLPILIGEQSICQSIFNLTQDVGHNGGATKDWDELIESGQYSCEYRLQALDRARIHCVANLSQTHEGVSLKCLDDSSWSMLTELKISFDLDASPLKTPEYHEWKFGTPVEFKADVKTTESHSSGN